MFAISTHQKIISLLFLCSISFLVKGQRLIESRQTSYYTFIYKLTDQEAKTIFKKNTRIVDQSYFHTLVDSFPTDNEYIGILPTGHYLKTYAEKNIQRFQITSVPDFDVKTLNNNTDLYVQVYDLKGNVITGADVHVRMKKLRFDKKTQAYVDKKSNRKGYLNVSFNGYTAWFDLSRQYKNSAIKRGTRTIVFGTPLKYAWIPVRYVLFLPIDGVRSIVNGWPRGTISRTKQFFVRSWEKFAVIFDDSYYRYYDNKFKYKHTGYIVFNKPQYRQGDTVKFKAFLLTKKGKPVESTVSVVLNTNKKSIELVKLKPYLKGGYEYQFPLHDSLNLQLDRNYYLYLENKHSKEYFSGSFRYEDYELSKNQLEIRMANDKHYKDRPLILFAKGTDENNLNLMDGRLEILVKSKDISEYFEKSVFIPDTLYYTKKELSPTEETEIAIPDSIFPKANFSYEIIVRLLTSDNEGVTQQKQVTYYYLKREFDLSLTADSIEVLYKENGVSKEKQIQVTATDNFGYSTKVGNLKTPCKLCINPYFKKYTVKVDSLEQSLDVSSEPSLIRCLSERNSDSLTILVDNPRKLPFTYNIYKRNKEQKRGYSDSLSLTNVSAGKKNYFVSVRYLWGGKITEENYRIPYMDKKLNVAIKQPKIVYPGQKTKIEVSVTDNKNKPVAGVDLTAYSLTKKFNYSAPELPYLGKRGKDKLVINNFTLKDIKTDGNAGLKLDYPEWNLRFGLDSIEYYRFLYPGNELYRFEYTSKDSITQFAPFVITDGGIEPVHVIYVDSKPVYFSWSTNTQPYSFKIDSGYHQVKLRTRYQNITIDRLYFDFGKKVVFSFNHDLIQKNIRSEKVEPQLSPEEKRQLYRYIFPYLNTFGEKYAYITQHNEVQFLKPSVNSLQVKNMAGPVSGNLTFTLLDGFSTNFNHEPLFEYDFAPGLLKMRSVDPKFRYPSYLSYIKTDQYLSDLALTKQKIQSQWDSYVDYKRQLTAHYTYPSSTSPGAGRLQINLINTNTANAEYPLNILVLRYDNPRFLRIYPGNTTLIHQLDKGLYKLLFFYRGAKYSIADSLSVHPDGLNYFKITEPKSFHKDKFSETVSKIIEETLFKTQSYGAADESELKQIYNLYQQQFSYTGEGGIVDGFVYEETSGEALPGVTVLVKGTTYGTLTDLKGHYSIKLPPDRSVLEFSFIGFEPQEVTVGYNNIINIRLKSSAQHMDGVVVTAMGISRKSSSVGYSIATVSSNSTGIPGINSDIMESLTGRVAGVQITQSGIPGSTVSIQLRGSATTNFDKTPLFIIDGNVYTGNISDLDPALIEKIEILKDAGATAMYGALGSNGVVLISTKSGSFKSTAEKNKKGSDYDNAFFEAASKSSSIRENFSDYAFWQPKLTTDKNGKASFDVTFPDDVTSWETFYLAMNDARQSGQIKSVIKSYKPLMAQLAVPRFLVQSDTTYVIGKALNYSPDPVNITTHFEVNSESEFSKTQVCVNSLLDTLKVIAPKDSISIKYYLEKPDGYFDGELKTIPVFPIGLEETKGSFLVLQNDTTFDLAADTALGKVTLYAGTGLLDVIENEIGHVISYRYLCNEQLASKLKAMLAWKLIAKYKGTKFTDDRAIERLISLLLKNEKDRNLWGWWKDSDVNFYISLHALEALSQAKAMGFEVKLNENELTQTLIWELDNKKDFSNRIKLLRILRLMDSPVNYQAYVNELERFKNVSLNNKLQLLELKQLCNIAFTTDSIKSYQQETLFGNIYFSDNKADGSLFDNDMENSIYAYTILRNDTAANHAILGKMRNYFLEKRGSGYWRNTYESSRIIEAILPDLMGKNNKLDKPILRLSGNVNQTVTNFPFEMILNSNQNITVAKTGDFPVYFTTIQRYWNPDPVLKSNDFIITTGFDNADSTLLKAGKETRLIVKLTVKKDADYVMINVPIPGGCSYSVKGNNYRNEIHREYFKNETTIFCEKLNKGEYKFEINLVPRYSGTYMLNPAKVELMYYPTFSANTELKKIKIK